MVLPESGPTANLRFNRLGFGRFARPRRLMMAEVLGAVFEEQDKSIEISLR
jgi:hypothetical protein